MYSIFLLATMIGVYYTIWKALTSNNLREVLKPFLWTVSLSVGIIAWPTIENTVAKTRSKVNTWIIVREAQPEWHARQKKIIGHYATLIGKDYTSSVCRYWDGIGSWLIHRDRVRIHNAYVAHYQKVVMRDLQGFQYQGMEKALPPTLEPCSAPERPVRF